MEKQVQRRNILVLLIIGLMVAVTLILTFINRWDHSKSTTGKCTPQETETTNLEVGSCAPNFRLPDLNGNEIELYAENQKPTFVNFLGDLVWTLSV